MTIFIINEYTFEQELDLPPVASQIREKTKKGEDEETTAAFVQLLAVAAKEKEDEVRKKIVKDYPMRFKGIND